jgi:hypothetical protein
MYYKNMGYIPEKRLQNAFLKFSRLFLTQRFGADRFRLVFSIN